MKYWVPLCHCSIQFSLFYTLFCHFTGWVHLGEYTIPTSSAMWSFRARKGQVKSITVMHPATLIVAQSERRKCITNLWYSCPWMAVEQRVFFAVMEAVQHHGYTAMQPEQLQIVSRNSFGRDIFAVLPRLWEEPVICVPSNGGWPNIADRETSIVLVVSPLLVINERSGKRQWIVLLLGSLTYLAVMCMQSIM